MNRLAYDSYDKVTGGRLLGNRTGQWLDDLVARFGDAAVAEAIDAEAAGGNFNRLLGRVRDRLAVRASRRPAAPTPMELTGREVLAIAQGKKTAPAEYIFDTRDLSSDEYTELLALRPRR